MQDIKGKITDITRGLVERMGFLINPVLLKIFGEKNQLLVFYFHGLYESAEHKNLAHIDPQQNITVEQFIAFIEYFLDNNYSFISPGQLLGDLPEGRNYIIITFDDGYYNNMLALDVLNKYKIPAVFFITAGNVIENKSFWWDIIYKYRTKQGLGAEKIHDEQEQLKLFKYDYIDNYIKDTFGNDSFKPWSDVDRPMTEAEVKKLSENHFATIGNHTYNHAILTNYNKAEVENEFISTNRYLSKIIGITPDTVAFPNGNCNKLTLDAANELGFRIAFNAIPKKNYLPVDKSKMINLGRFMTNTKTIRKYGSFYRLGYTPGSLFSHLVSFLNIFGRQQ